MIHQEVELNDDQLGEIFLIAKLVGRYKEGTLSKRESDQLQQWLDASPGNKERFDNLLNERDFAERLRSLRELEADSAGEFERVAAMAGIEVVSGKRTKGSRRGRIGRISVLAVLVVAGVSLLVYQAKVYTHRDMTVASIKDIPPGGNKATLTLGNGQVVVLDSAGNGLVAQQGDAKVLKTASGEIAYTTGKAKENNIVFNTITTPVTGQFKVVLSDGSQVFLNSSSSLRYPSAFTGSAREVTLTGEAYFEVAKNKSLPFVVNTENGSNVKVLGTHFDIMAYNDEPTMKTTLLEGSVLVSNGSNSGLLNPGDQADVSKSGDVKVVQRVDVDEAVAWKNGLFQFDHADLQTILRQVSRWYGVEVVYKGNIPTDPFKGEAPRNISLTKLLQGLTAMTGVQFQMEGNKLIVSH